MIPDVIAGALVTLLGIFALREALKELRRQTAYSFEPWFYLLFAGLILAMGIG
jgi:hypothetical protein